MYVSQCTSVDELKSKIEEAFVTVKRDTEVLTKLKHNLRKRANKCIGQGGGHFESIMKVDRRNSVN